MRRNAVPTYYFMLLGFICLLNFSHAVSANTTAPDYSQLNDEQFETLINIKKSFAEIEQLQQQGALNEQQAQGAKTYILLQQQALMEQPIATPTLQQLVLSCMQDERCREKSLMDRFRGLFSFVNIVWFIASILILYGLLLVLSAYKRAIYRVLRPIGKLFHAFFSVLLPKLAALLRRVPILIYEMLALLSTVLLVFAAKLVTITSQSYLAFIANILVMLVLSTIYRNHEKSINQFYIKHYKLLRHGPRTLLMALLCGFWAFTSIYFQSQLLGFFTIALLLFWLGFNVIITPLVYSFGFDERANIIKGTSGAFILLLIHVGITLSQVQLPYYTYFATGIQYPGAFVFYISLLIASNKWACKYYKFNYILMQVITISAGMAALYIGSIYTLPVLRGIGGTFFALYLIEKQFEIRWGKKRLAWLVLLLGISLYAIAHVVTLYPEYFFMYAAE